MQSRLLRSALKAAHSRGVATLRPESGIIGDRKVSVIGAPMAYGQPRGGTEFGPNLIRSLGLVTAIEDIGWKVHDMKDAVIPEPTAQDPVSRVGGKNTFSVGIGNRNIADLTANACKEGHMPLVVGGDHSVAIGSIAGILSARPSTGVLWVDAHADINSPQISPSGNVHGMPLSFLCHHFDPRLVPGFEWLGSIPALSVERLVYIGLRDVDRGEKEAIKHYGIKAFTMTQIDKYGIGKVMEMAMDHLNKHGVNPIHLSFDIDAVDPTLAPATGTRVMGGLNFREAHFLCEEVAATGLLGSMDIVEVNPKLSDANGAEATAKLAVGLVESALGKSIL